MQSGPLSFAWSPVAFVQRVPRCPQTFPGRPPRRADAVVPDLLGLVRYEVRLHQHHRSASANHFTRTGQTSRERKDGTTICRRAVRGLLDVLLRKPPPPPWWKTPVAWAGAAVALVTFFLLSKADRRQRQKASEMADMMKRLELATEQSPKKARRPAASGSLAAPPAPPSAAGSKTVVSGTAVPPPPTPASAADTQIMPPPVQAEETPAPSMPPQSSTDAEPVPSPEQTSTMNAEVPRDVVLGGGLRAKVLQDEDAVLDAAAEEVLSAASAAIAEKGAFSICVPGGFGAADGVTGSDSWVAKAMVRLTKQPDVDFSKFHVFFCGDRLETRESYSEAQRLWLTAAAVPEAQVHPVPTQLPPEGAAAKYTALICGQEEDVISDSPSGLPAMDLVLLDVAADGTVGRVAPGSAEAAEAGSEKLVLPVENPGKEAIAVSLDLMNAARRALLLAPAGDTERASVVANALKTPSAGTAASPAGLIRAADTLWLLDTSSAAMLE